MTSAKTLVYLRADGNSEIGLGHVHRLLALSEILKPNFDCRFIIQSPLPGIRKLINESCEGLLEISGQNENPDEVTQHVTGNEIIVLDGYHFNTAYQQRLKQTGNKVVSIDDLHQNHFVSDVVINPAGGLDKTLYNKEVTTKVFSGPGYALLKKPFLAGNRDRKSLANSIFICMGGADPDNHTLTTLKHCLNFPFDSFKIVIGEAYLFKEELNKEAKKSDHDIQILVNLNPSALANIMSQCSVAVCSASGISYEYLSIGGELYVKQTASNQADMYNYLVKSKLAFSFEDFRVDKEFVSLSNERQHQIFDGNSGKRILKIFNRLDYDLHTKIRKASASDLMATFHWANEPEIRSQSFNTAPIPLDDHIAWYHRKLNDPATIFYIFEYKKSPIAQVRFDIQMEAIVSYSIDSGFRGRGWGQCILQKAIDSFLEERGSIKIVGFVKQENVSSNIIFKNLGFLQQVANEYPNSYKYEL